MASQSTPCMCVKPSGCSHTIPTEQRFRWSWKSCSPTCARSPKKNVLKIISPTKQHPRQGRRQANRRNQRLASLCQILSKRSQSEKFTPLMKTDRKPNERCCPPSRERVFVAYVLLLGSILVNNAAGVATSQKSHSAESTLIC